MNREPQHTVRDVAVFVLLIAIGVAGRWAQPLWAFTPIAATAVFAGAYFSRAAIAAMVPIGILAVSDLLLPAYNSVPVLLVTYAAMVAPVWLGRLLRGENRVAATAWKLALCGLVPATLFFIASNFAVWAFQSDYEKSLAGLLTCYTAAVPFYRWMLAGDIFYLAVLAGCYLASSATVARTRACGDRLLHHAGKTGR